MRRREFIAGLGSAAAWPVVARAQPAERMRRIGVLMVFEKNDPAGEARFSEFAQGLSELGWAPGPFPHHGSVEVLMNFRCPATRGFKEYASSGWLAPS